MAVDIANLVDDGIYQIRATYRDRFAEETRKQFEMRNPATGETLEDMFVALDALQYAGVVKISADIDAQATGSTTIETTENVYNAAAIVLVLGFERGHPRNAAKTITNSFGLIAPNTSLIASFKPSITHTVEDTFADAVTINDRLGALVSYLEDNLIYRDPVTDEVTVGGWAYSAARSGVVQSGRLLDGIANT